MTNSLKRSGFMPARVVHLHPSRFCNLACRHCYSVSGPGEHRGTAPESLIPALALLRREGYEVLSLSGGEPLLYPGLHTLVEAATALGFQVNAISNGAPVQGPLLETISKLNLLAISLDGAPETHIDLRGHKNAFAYVERALEHLATLGIGYGLSYCISRRSLVDMPWALDFAAERGAKLLQFHPFAAVGRGSQYADALTLSSDDLSRAYVISKLLEAQQDVTVQLDIAAVASARDQRGDYDILAIEDATHLSLSDLINPIIIDETGGLVPFSYGIHSQFAIGRVGPTLDGLITDFKRTGWLRVRTLLDSAFGMLDTHDGDFVDWFHHIVKTSHDQALNLQPA